MMLPTAKQYELAEELIDHTADAVLFANANNPGALPDEGIINAASTTIVDLTGIPPVAAVNLVRLAIGRIGERAGIPIPIHTEDERREIFRSVFGFEPAATT